MLDAGSNRYEWTDESNDGGKHRELAAEQEVRPGRNRRANDPKCAAEKQRGAPPDLPTSIRSANKNYAHHTPHVKAA